jgi:hypothetical protein
MAQRAMFDSKQKSWVGETLEIAETLAQEYFEVDLDDFERFPYDLQTLANLQGPEKTRRALAQVCRYEYQKSNQPRKITPKQFYRICLQDDKILDRTNKETPEILRPLLLYVISHELIHVIRFSMDPERFHLSPKEKIIEEKSVHRMTYELLKTFKDPWVELLLHHYRRWWASGALDKAGGRS